MMTEEQKLTMARLKAAIAASSPTAVGAPPEVRAAALALKDELRRTGTTARVLAKALGVHETTLVRWQRAHAPSRGHSTPTQRGRARGASFREVQLADASSARIAHAAVSVPAARSLRVAHAPSGLVIDGLDVESLAALLRRMS